MAILLRKSILLVLICMMVTMPLASAAFGAQPEDLHAKDVKAGAMAADVLVIRPFSLVATILGTAVFVVAAPFAALGGNIGEAFDNLMAKPAKFTFKRPLGEFD